MTRPRTVGAVRFHGSRNPSVPGARLPFEATRKADNDVVIRTPRYVEPMIVTTCRRLPTGPLCVMLALIVVVYFIGRMVW